VWTFEGTGLTPGLPPTVLVPVLGGGAAAPGDPFTYVAPAGPPTGVFSAGVFFFSGTPGAYTFDVLVGGAPVGFFIVTPAAFPSAGLFALVAPTPIALVPGALVQVNLTAGPGVAECRVCLSIQ
jgi:hypothetical protein